MSLIHLHLNGSLIGSCENSCWMVPDWLSGIRCSRVWGSSPVTGNCGLLMGGLYSWWRIEPPDDNPVLNIHNWPVNDGNIIIVRMAFIKVWSIWRMRGIWIIYTNFIAVIWNMYTDVGFLWSCNGCFILWHSRLMHAWLQAAGQRKTDKWFPFVSIGFVC